MECSPTPPEPPEPAKPPGTPEPTEPATPPQAPSSRVSQAGAGWQQCGGPGVWRADVPVGTKPSSWLRPATLWRARNDIVARLLFDPTDDARRAWIALAHERAAATGADPDFVVTLPPRTDAQDATSFLLFGDSGEGDASQYAVVPGLLAHAAGADFAFIASDVIYPGGDSADYRAKFYRPYRALPLPIYAIPGNHDWYDGLHGFMHHLCDLDGPPLEAAIPGRLRRAVQRLLWRRSVAPPAAELAAMKTLRAAPEQERRAPQPAPYFAMDVGPLRLVCIDTGIRGQIDADQAAWLRRVSLASGRPKVLITGKPIIVNNTNAPGEIEGEEGTVDEIVRDPRHGYVAAIGGDIHNYQRYPVTLDDGRVIEYIVSGGGGAFMHATHQIDKVTIPGTDEARFRCYPLRGDSLARYSQLYDGRLGRFGRGRLRLEPHEASAYLSRLYDIPVTRGGPPVALSRRARLAAKVIQPLPAQRSFQRFVSEAVDWDDPPLFKHFLRIDATPTELRIRCFGVTGCRNSEGAPSQEDEVVIAL